MRKCVRRFSYFSMASLLVAALSVLMPSEARGADDAPAAAPALNALVGADGAMRLSSGTSEICTFSAGLFEKGWKQQGASGTGNAPAANSAVRTFKLTTSTGASILGEATFSGDKGVLSSAFQFTPEVDNVIFSLHVSANFAAPTLIGQKWAADDKSGDFPEIYKDAHLFNGEVKTLKLTLAKAGEMTLTFNAPTAVLIQDNRQWGPNFEIRIGPQTGPDGLKLKKGEPIKFGYTLAAIQKINLEFDVPGVIAAGAEWIPLKVDLNIEPDSALDFSKMGFNDTPAGKAGRVIARPDGQFAFEKEPGRIRRFYGVNLCFGANYMSHEQADILADRLMRLGYNAVRIHHYEGELSDKQPSSLAFNAEKLDQLDYLLAAFGKRGLYITTDLFVSRPVKNEELGLKSPGNVEMDTFKILVPVHAAAWENWKSFSKALLDHVNPYTKLRYAEDPALAWIAMINEGLYGNFLDRERKIPEWNAAWNKWLAKQYPNRDALAAAWKTELKPEEDFIKSTVAMPDNIYNSTARTRDCCAFYSTLERETVERMTKFLHEDLGCKALITNGSAWTNHLSDQVERTAFDYVDDHFYIDHPNFLQRQWSLPSRCPNTNPIESGAPGGRSCCFTRLYGKPFTITEYNYAAPGRFRGVGGILTGALGAIQGWGGIWRFAYSHSRDGLFKPERLDYFNMASDPLGQAAERASICLFLRGDMKPAAHSVAIDMTINEALSAKPMPHLSPAWNWIGWITQVGTEVVRDFQFEVDAKGDIHVGEQMIQAKDIAVELPKVLKGHERVFMKFDRSLKPESLSPIFAITNAAGIKNLTMTGGKLPVEAHNLVLPMGEVSKTAYNRAVAGTEGVNPYTASSDKIMLLLKLRGVISENNPTDPARNYFKSETGEITIDGPHGILLLDTPRTAGGYAPAGQIITSQDRRIIVSVADSDATVWASSLDGEPLATSNHILVTHLTDLQNTDIKYQEKARQTLLDWGKLPHLVRNGKANIRLRITTANNLKVYALSTSGKRIGEVKSTVSNGGLEFTANVAEGAEENGARMLYEVAP